MKHRGPIITLAVGAVFAAVLLILDLNSEPPAGTAQVGGGDHPPSSATAPAPTTTAPTTPPPAPAPPNATYAGNVDGGSGASVAIAIKNGQAVAYLCDGRTEAWLQGNASATVALTGAGNATLTGTFAGGKISGSITAAGKTWTFSVGAVAPPSGLYRAAAQVREARVVGGWIVLADGRQVGVVDVDGQPGTAQELNTTTLTSTVNGTTITATAVDGSPIPLGQ
jgi:serine/threonine-protein kinase